jgi:hypothetical protein
MNIIALFRLPAPLQPASTLEARVARLERQIRFYEELSDEQHYRLVDLETALERGAVSDATVSA